MKPAKLKDFTPDRRNANKGTDRGRQLLRESLSELKAGRSILVDAKNNVIAGNKTREAAIAAGIEGAIVVETDGTKLVVVKRVDLDLETDEEAKKLAIADNRIGEISLEWSTEVLAELSEETDLSGLWTEDEWQNLTDPDGAITEEPDTEPSGVNDQGAAYQNQFAVAIECDTEAEQERVYNLLSAQGYKCKVLTL